MGEESKARVIARQSHHPVIADLIRNPEVKGWDDTKTDQLTESPSLDGRGIKDDGEQDNTNPNQSPLHMPIHVKSPMKRGDAAPYLSMPVPPLWILP